MNVYAVNMLAPTMSNEEYFHLLGLKKYELANHLGNVIGVITDKKVPQGTTGSPVSRYHADLIYVQDYYPFGALMDGRVITK